MKTDVAQQAESPRGVAATWQEHQINSDLSGEIGRERDVAVCRLDVEGLEVRLCGGREAHDPPAEPRGVVLCRHRRCGISTPPHPQQPHAAARPATRVLGAWLTEGVRLGLCAWRRHA